MLIDIQQVLNKTRESIEDFDNQLYNHALNHPNSVSKIQAIIVRIEAQMKGIRADFLQTTPTLAQEITFFKELKPYLFAQFMTANFRLMIMLFQGKNNLEEDLIYLKKFYKKNKAEKKNNKKVRRYLKEKRTDLDSVNLTRLQNIQMPKYLSDAIDGKYNTLWDREISKIISVEMNMKYLKNEIARVKTLINTKMEAAKDKQSWFKNGDNLCEDPVQLN